MGSSKVHLSISVSHKYVPYLKISVKKQKDLDGNDLKRLSNEIEMGCWWYGRIKHYEATLLQTCQRLLAALWQIFYRGPQGISNPLDNIYKLPEGIGNPLTKSSEGFSNYCK